MICPICKSNIRDGSVFCPVCGKPVPQDNPDIHNIETVELPKDNDSQSAVFRHSEISAAETAESPVQEASAENVPRPAPSQQAAQEPVPDQMDYDRPSGSAPYSGDAPQGSRPQRARAGAAPHPQSDRQAGGAGRPYHQYQNGPRQGQQHGQPGHHQASRQQGMDRKPASMLSEPEQFHIRKTLSTRALVAFICSIFGICSVAVGLPCAIVGLVISIIVRNEYRNRGFQKDTDLKLANAAFVCSIIGIVIGVIGLIILMATGAGIAAGLSALASMGSGGSYYGF